MQKTIIFRVTSDADYIDPEVQPATFLVNLDDKLMGLIKEIEKLPKVLQSVNLHFYHLCINAGLGTWTEEIGLKKHIPDRHSWVIVDYTQLPNDIEDHSSVTKQCLEITPDGLELRFVSFGEWSDEKFHTPYIKVEELKELLKG